MEIIFVILQVVICILLVLIVLLQFGKGAQTSGFLSGASSDSMLPSSTKGNFFTKFTTGLAIAFMLNSIVLTKLKSGAAQRSVIEDAPISAPLSSDQGTGESPAATKDQEESQSPEDGESAKDGK